MRMVAEATITPNRRELARLSLTEVGCNAGRVGSTPRVPATPTSTARKNSILRCLTLFTAAVDSGSVYGLALPAGKDRNGRGRWLAEDATCGRQQKERPTET